MSACRPVLGSPSKREAIIALARQGVEEADIAVQVDSALSNVQNVLRAAGLRDISRMPRQTRQSIPARVRPDTLNTLETQARLRRTTANKLAARLLDLIARGNLFLAVLDDAATLTDGGEA